MSNRVPPKSLVAWNPLGIELPQVKLPDVREVVESVTRTVAPAVEAITKPYEPIVDVFQRAEPKSDPAPKSPRKATTPASDAPSPTQVLDFIKSTDRAIDHSAATPGVRQEVRQQLARTAERLRNGEISPSVAAKQASLWTQQLDSDARSQAREASRRTTEIDNMSVADKALDGAQGIGRTFLGIGKSAVDLAHIVNGFNPVLALSNVASDTILGTLTTGDVGKSFQRGVDTQVKNTGQAFTNVGNAVQAVASVATDLDNVNPVSLPGKAVLNALGNGGDLKRAASDALEASRNSGARLLNLAGDISGVNQILTGAPGQIAGGVTTGGLLLAPWAKTRVAAPKVHATYVDQIGLGRRPVPRLPGQSHPITIDVAATTVVEPGALVAATKPGALVAATKPGALARRAPAVSPARAREALAATDRQRAVLDQMVPSKTISPAHVQQNALFPELKVQLWTNTLTNVQPGTMESGKWSTAVAKFEGAKTVPDAVEKIAGIVRQYQHEWTVLHGRSLKFFNDVNAPVLKDFGIAIDPRTGFARADLSKLTPQKASLLEQQLAAALGTPPPAPPPPPPPPADPLAPFRAQADAIVKQSHALYDVNGKPMQMMSNWWEKLINIDTSELEDLREAVDETADARAFDDYDAGQESGGLDVTSSSPSRPPGYTATKRYKANDSNHTVEALQMKGYTGDVPVMITPGGLRSVPIGQIVPAPSDKASSASRRSIDELLRYLDPIPVDEY